MPSSTPASLRLILSPAFCRHGLHAAGRDRGCDTLGLPRQNRLRPLYGPNSVRSICGLRNAASRGTNCSGARGCRGAIMTGLTVQALIRRVDLFTLKLFLTAIEEGQIGRAAAREHIVPSAATKRIQELEELAGIKLFERTAKGVIPSPAGLVFARHIRMVLATLDDLRRELGGFVDGVRGRIAIAAPGLLIVQFLANEIGEFTRRFPLVEVELRQETNADALRALFSGEVDLAVFSRSADMDYDGIEDHECRTDSLVAVV